MANKGWIGNEVSDIEDHPEATETSNEQVLPNVILVEFNFTNGKRIPSGIPRKERTNTVVKEAARGFQFPGSYQKDLGKVETGEHKEVDNVTVRQFVREIGKQGYKLSGETHYFKKDNGKGFTVITEWIRTSEIAKIPEETMYGIRVLTEIFGWKFCHLWQNPAEKGKTVWAVNLMHIMLPDEIRKTNIKDLSLKKWIHSPVYNRQEVNPCKNSKPRRIKLKR